MIPEYFIQEWKGSEIDYRVKQIPLTFASKKIFIRQVPITRGKEGYCWVILFFLLTLIGVLFGKAML